MCVDENVRTFSCDELSVTRGVLAPNDWPSMVSVPLVTFTCVLSMTGARSAALARLCPASVQRVAAAKTSRAVRHRLKAAKRSVISPLSLGWKAGGL
jgi:hypothetical protein